MQNMYKCKFFKWNKNFNLTCCGKDRCVLISDRDNCYKYNERSAK